MARVIILFVSMILCLHLNAFASGTMRCSRGIVSVGTSMSAVKNKCGEPTNTSVVEIKTKVTSRGSGVSDRDEISRVEEVWEYDFGKNKFMKTLTFEGTKLKKIETGGYGSR